MTVEQHCSTVATRLGSLFAILCAGPSRRRTRHYNAAIRWS